MQMSLRSLVVSSLLALAACQGQPSSNAPAGKLGSVAQGLIGTTPPSVVLTSSAASNTSALGDSVTFTATVGGSSGTPTGTVQFSDSFGGSTVTLGGPVTLSGGTASMSTSALALGQHNIQAAYSGDATYAAASDSLLQTVLSPTTTTLAVGSPASPSTTFSQDFTLTATVTASGSGAAPSGTVNLLDNGNPIGTGVQVTLDQASCPAVVAGVACALFDTRVLPAAAFPGAFGVGTHSLTAVFVGDGSYFGSSSSVLSEVVTAASTSITVNSTPSTSVFGQSVHFTAIVVPLAPADETNQDATGTVTFSENGVSLADPVTLANGVANLDLSTLGAQASPHQIVATFNPDTSNYSTSTTASAYAQQVTKASASVNLTSDNSPSVFGQQVNFTATVAAVAPGVGTPGGQVQFKDTTSSGTVNLGQPVTLVAGVASFPTSALTVLAAGHKITAAYLGDGNFAAHTSFPAFTQNVTKAASSTALATVPSASVAGQSVQLTATVSSTGSFTPTGSVQFLDGAGNLGGPVTLSNGSAQINVAFSAFSPVMPHNLTARYLGDVNFNGSTSPGVSQAVTKATPAVTFAAGTPVGSVSGQTLTLTANASAQAPGAGTPSGTVSFFLDGTQLGSSQSLVSGAASLSTTLGVGGTVGDHQLSIGYSGDNQFLAGSSANFTHTVTKSNTLSAITSADPGASTVFGQPVSFSVTVAAIGGGSGTPTGNVEFFNGSTSLGTVALSGGTATSAPVSAIGVGSASITAVYAGDNAFNGSTSSGFSQSVAPASTTTLVAAGDAPSLQTTAVFGQAVQLRAAVVASAPGAGTPSGTVQFTDTVGQTTVNVGAPATLASGSATISVSTLSTGSHLIRAIYSGDTSFSGSSSPATGGNAFQQTINPADTTTTVATSGTPAVFGQSVTFTATVAANAPGAGSPTGSVSFADGGQPIGSGTIVAGQATFTTSALAVGNGHLITAAYQGDGNFNTSASDAQGLAQAVSAADTSISSVVSSANPSTFGGGVTLTATLVASSPSTATPDSGTVTFSEGGTTLSTAALVNGSAVSEAISSLGAGDHSISVSYSGTDSFNGSSTSFTQSVNPAPTGTGTGDGTGQGVGGAIGVAVQSSQNPSVFGQPVSFSANFTASGQATQPTGSVTFKEGSTVLSSANLDGTQTATFATSGLSTGGTHAIWATYGGDANYAAGSLFAVVQTVNQADVNSAVVGAPSSIIYGQSVTMSATVSAKAPGAGTPSGTVDFIDSTSGATLASGIALVPAPTAVVDQAQEAGETTLTLSSFVAIGQTFQVGTTGQLAGIQLALNNCGNVARGHLVLDVFNGGSLLTGPSIDVSTLPTDCSTSLPASATGGGYIDFGGPIAVTAGQVLTISLARTGDYQVVGQGDATISLSSSDVYANGTASIDDPDHRLLSQDLTFRTVMVGSAPNGAAIASASTSALGAGSHDLVVHYSGDSNFNAATSGAFTETVSQASTTTSVASSGSPTVFGQSVTFTASVAPVAPGAGSPTGTVNFFDGATQIGSGDIADGQATFTTNLLSVATHPISASYAGDDNFAASGSESTSQVVGRSDTAIASVTSSINPTVFGQGTTLTATVAAQQIVLGPSGPIRRSPANTFPALPSGTVTFMEGQTVLGTGTLGDGSASIDLSTLAVGAHAIVAVYGGDDNYAGSDSSAIPFSQTVSQAATSATVSSVPNPSVSGQAVILTAAISVQSPGAGTPTGTVSFFDGSTGIGSGAVSAGHASLSVDSLPVGAAHSITAVYNGDASFAASAPSAPYLLEVDKDQVVNALAAAPSPSVYGRTVTFTATVDAASPGAGTPTGTVDFLDNGVVMANASGMTLATAQVSAVDQEQTSGGQDSWGFQSGDMNAVIQTFTVGQTGMLTSIQVDVRNCGNQSAGNMRLQLAGADHVAIGDPVLLDLGSLPTGCSGNVDLPAADGPGTFTFASPVAVTAGQALEFTLSPAYDTGNIVIFMGSSGTYPAGISYFVGGRYGSNPSPKRNLYDEKVAFRTSVSTTRNQATFSTSSLGAGNHQISSRYNGDASFAANTNEATSLDIAKADTQVLVSSSLTPTLFQQSVTFTAEVRSASPGALVVAGGTVEFRNVDDGTVVLGTGTVSCPPVITGPTQRNTRLGCTASFSTSTLAVGAHTIEAAYLGDDNFNGSSNTVGQVVSQDTPVITFVSVIPQPAGSDGAASVEGQSVAVTIKVASSIDGAPIFPSGAVHLTGDGLTQLDGTLDSSGQVTLTGPMTRVCGTTSPCVASLQLAYDGDANFASNSNSASHTVNRADSAIAASALIGSNITTSSVHGQAVTLAALVSAVAPGVGSPGGGSLGFYDVTSGAPGTFIGAGTFASGIAVFSTSALSTGAHTIRAVYGLQPVGDSTEDVHFNGSSTGTEGQPDISLVVNKADTSVAIAGPSGTVTYGDQVAYSATASAVSPGAGQPTGSIGFTPGGVQAMNEGSTAGFTTQPYDFTAGTNHVSAAYGGDTNFNAAATAGYDQFVNQAQAQVGTVQTDGVNYVFGQTINFSVTVQPANEMAAGADLAGVVTFIDGSAPGTGLNIGRVDSSALAAGQGYSLSNNVATFTLQIPLALATGTHNLIASYAGRNFSNASSGTPAQIVVGAATTSTLLANADFIGFDGDPSSVFNQPVSLVAEVSPQSNSLIAPTGTVLFAQGTNAIGVATLVAVPADGSAPCVSSNILLPDGGVAPAAFARSCARMTTSILPVGSDPITAIFLGDADYATSTSAAINQVVAQDGTAIAVTADVATTFGQTAQIIATVIATGPQLTRPTRNVRDGFWAVAPDAKKPSGTVVFTDTTTGLVLSAAGGVPVIDGVARLPIASLAIGAHAISASYSGDLDYLASTSDTATQTVNQAATAVTVLTSASPSQYGASATFTAIVTTAAEGVALPSGTVHFMDGETDLGTAAVDQASGIAVFTTNGILAQGSHTITAAYLGDSSYSGSSGSVAQQVSTGGAQMSLSSSQNPATIGDVATFTATVGRSVEGGAQPTGGVSFFLGNSAYPGNPVQLVNGSAQITFPPSGTLALVAVYGGDTNYAPASASIVQMTFPANPTVTLTPSTATPVRGDDLSLAVVVAGGGNNFTPSGMVTILDGNAVVASGALVSGSATLHSSSLAAGPHSLTAVYAGDTNFTPATSASAGITVGLSDTTLVASSSSASAAFGQSVTLTAKVTSTAAGLITGTVLFTTGNSNVIGTAVVDSSGTATFATSTLAVGNGQVITAAYSGDVNFASSVNTVVESVAKGGAVVTLASSPNPSTFASGNAGAVQLTTTVRPSISGAQQPGGTIAFSEGATVYATVTVDGSGNAATSVTGLSAGSHSITASYSGDGEYAAASVSASQTVKQAPSNIDLASSVNPAVAGQQTVLSATVTGLGASNVPTGVVTFKDGATVLGAIALDGSGVATLPAASFSVSGHLVTASYSGDGSFLATSGQLLENVSKSAVAVALGADLDSPVFGQFVTYTANVSASAPGAGSPSGTVIFRVDQGAIPASIVEGQATLSLSTLSAGAHSVTAFYLGDANFAQGTSSAIDTSVSQASTSVALTPASQTVNLGDALTLVATATTTAPGAGAPSGTITFLDGAVALGVGTLDGTGQATFTTSSLLAATHSITARFEGDAGHSASTSAASIITVQQLDLSVSLVASISAPVFGQPEALTAVVSGSRGQVPTGSVTLSDTFGGSTSAIGSAALVNGVVTFQVNSGFAVGTHALSASYGGDANYTGTSAGSLALVVGQAGSTTSLGISPSPAAFGQAVTLAAQVSPVAPGAGSPSGTVTFRDGAMTIGTGSVSAGVATLSTSTLARGTHAISASYATDGSFSSSASAASAVLIEQSSTTVSVAQSVNPSVYGQAVTFSATVAPSLGGAGTPSGAVLFIFLDGSTPTAPASLNSGVASVTMSSIGVGAHFVNVIYLGDSAFSTSNGSFTQTVSQAASTTTLASSSASPVFGQPVTLTATVAATAPGAGIPSGSVAFSDGGSVLGTAAIDGSGTAQLTVSNLSVGPHSMSAAYAGSANHGASTSASLSQPVAKAATSVALSASSASAVFGQSVTFSAKVSVSSPGAGAPAGTVQFFDGGTSLGSIAIDGSGAASISTSALAVAAHGITATYSGDGSFTASTSASQPVSVGKSSASASVVASVNPSAFGQSVVFTATVAAQGPGAGQPTGSVDFLDGTSVVQSGVALDNAGTALLTTSSLVAGAHAITARYSGDASFSAVTSAIFTQSVARTDTTTALASTVTPSAFGQSITLSATVAPVAPGAGNATGTVAFLLTADATTATTVGTGTLVNGVATLTTAVLPVGLRRVTALYLGDANYLGSTSAEVDQTINQAATSVSLTSTVSPSAYGQSVTFNASVAVTAPGAGSPTGTVTFFDGDGGTALQTVALTKAFTASFSTSALAVGPHDITAVYSGDTSFSTAASDALVQTVNLANTATTLATSASPAVFGQAVTLSVTVAAQAPGMGTPTGSVAILDGAQQIGTASLSAGAASFVTSAFAPGDHTLSAVYSSDGSFAGSTSAPVDQVIGKDGVAASLVSSANPSVYGAPVTFTVSVSAQVPGSGVPTGNVTFTDGLATLGSATLVNGTASISTAALTGGAHTIVASYVGDGDFGAIASAGLVEAVTAAATSTGIVSSQDPTTLGQSVTFTATVGSGVTASAGVVKATGSISFSDGNTLLASMPISSEGVATYTTAALSVATHQITASYGGDVNYAASASTPTPQEVDKAPTTTALISSANPSVSGQAVTLTATVANLISGTMTGSVSFFDGGDLLGTSLVGAGGVATFATSSFAVGSHSLTATYLGDGNFATSSADAVSQVVSKDGLAVALVSSQSSSVYGNSVTFTATLTAQLPGSGLPSGAVNFKDGSTSIGTAALASGVATLSTSALNAGTHAITATYGGDASFNGGASATLSQTVAGAETSIALAAAPSPAQFGQAVTITAQVSSAAPGAITGTLVFSDGAMILGSAAISAGGASAFTMTSFEPGDHVLTASYAGVGNYAGSTSAAAALHVDTATTGSTLVSSSNPSAYGQAITLTATVASAAGTPTGTVGFFEGATALGTGTVNASGIATFSTSSLAVASHAVTAAYQGDAHFAASTSAPMAQVVSKDASVLTVSSSANPGLFGSAFTLSASVATSAPGASMPSGTVMVSEGSAVLGTMTLDATGKASKEFSLGGGTHALTATYGGDANHAGGASASVAQVIAQAPTNVALTSSVAKLQFGSVVTFKASVTSAAPGIISGSVTFYDGATPVATIPIDASGNASLTTSSSFAVGTHAVSARYLGSADYAPGFSLSTNLVVTGVSVGGCSTNGPAPLAVPMLLAFALLAFRRRRNR